MQAHRIGAVATARTGSEWPADRVTAEQAERFRHQLLRVLEGGPPAAGAGADAGDSELWRLGVASAYLQRLRAGLVGRMTDQATLDAFGELAWEVTLTEEARAALMDRRKPWYLTLQTIETIKKLASGNWTPDLRYGAKSIEKKAKDARIDLYEARINKKARILWELGVDFSERSNDAYEYDVYDERTGERAAVARERHRALAERALTRHDHRARLAHGAGVAGDHQRHLAEGRAEGALDAAEVAHAEVDHAQVRSRVAHSVRVPLVDGSVVPSTRTASRRARAKDLNVHSTMWCRMSPSSLRTCRLHCAPRAKPSKNTEASSTSKVPSFALGSASRSTKYVLPERSRAV